MAADTRFVQDPEGANASSPPGFLLRLNNDEELSFTFTFVARRTLPVPNGVPNSPPAAPDLSGDTIINGLTFVSASTARDVENVLTREFHADPNLHKKPNVQLVGDFTTGGSPSVQFSWTWRWKPPKSAEDRGGGWRNSCSVSRVQAMTARMSCSNKTIVCGVQQGRAQARHLSKLFLLGAK